MSVNNSCIALPLTVFIKFKDALSSSKAIQFTLNSTEHLSHSLCSFGSKMRYLIKAKATIEHSTQQKTYTHYLLITIWTLNSTEHGQSSTGRTGGRGSNKKKQRGALQRTNH